MGCCPGPPDLKWAGTGWRLWPIVAELMEAKVMENEEESVSGQGSVGSESNGPDQTKTDPPVVTPQTSDEIIQRRRGVFAPLSLSVENRIHHGGQGDNAQSTDPEALPKLLEAWEQYNMKMECLRCHDYRGYIARAHEEDGRPDGCWHGWFDQKDYYMSVFGLQELSQQGDPGEDLEQVKLQRLMEAEVVGLVGPIMAPEIGATVQGMAA
ncbi:hypothetical protein NDU88_007722 [Pleurodeles waltl]|uniref:Uncharacterized protein n=1 Tax=Pleurodeles waltl TaxID=8319 RepID=A0AAV7VTP4_PLEWA|nr:hypothetical protein NDU88_007722 [Pleurodeles waltl]